MGPGILVTVTQVICILQLSDDSEASAYSGTDDNRMVALRILAIIFFFFISMKEVSSAFDAISYLYMSEFGRWSENKKKLEKEKEKLQINQENAALYKKKLEKITKNLNDMEEKLKGRYKIFLFILVKIIPQLFQIFICFWISRLNIYLISEAEDSIDLIQNFAGLAIILEFDNIVIAFLKYLRFYTLYDKFLESLNIELKSNELKKLGKEEKKERIAKRKKQIKLLKKDLEEIKKVKSTIVDDKKTELKNKMAHLKAIRNMIGKQTKQDLPASPKVKEKEKPKDKLKFLNTLINDQGPLKIFKKLAAIEEIKMILEDDEFYIIKPCNLPQGYQEKMNYFVLTLMITVSLSFIISYFSDMD